MLLLVLRVLPGPLLLASLVALLLQQKLASVLSPLWAPLVLMGLLLLLLLKQALQFLQSLLRVREVRRHLEQPQLQYQGTPPDAAAA